MKKIFITLLLGFILFSVLAKAERLYQYSVIAEIYKNNTVHYKLTIIVINNPSLKFSIPIISPHNIQTPKYCNIEEGMFETNIACSIEPSSKTDIIIEYYSDEKIIKKDNYFLFKDSFKMTNDVNTLSLLIKLPEGTGLKEPTESSYTPIEALIGSDGRRTIISWQKEYIESEDKIDVSIAFEEIGEIKIVPTSFVYYGILIAVIVALISGFVVFYRFYWKNRGVKIILPILKKDEKTIFDAIIKHGSGVNQKIIVKESGYSKAKVSKVLNSLKERGIIKLERLGRSNKVYVEKNFENKK